jgi:phage FluMu protein Com
MEQCSVDILCRKCGKKLAVNNAGIIEVRNGDSRVTVYGAIAVALECPRCGQVNDMAAKLPVKQLGVKNKRRS